MTEQEIDILEQIWEGKTNWEPECEQVLDNLAAKGYIEIIEKHWESKSGQRSIDFIIAKITDEGIGNLSSSAY